jgi:superoxide dismutase
MRTSHSPRATLPLVTCDLWELAYYIDYRNACGRYLEAFWRLANWGFVAETFRATARRAEATPALGSPSR